MGNWFCRPGPNLQDLSFLETSIKRAISRKHFENTIDENEIIKITNVISSGKKQQLELENYSVLFQKLVNFEKQIREYPQSRIVLEGKQNKRGLIFYSNGYYVGPIRNKKADGENGQMLLFTNQRLVQITPMGNLELIVRGEWREDYFLKGDFYDNNQHLLFSFEWKQQGREASLKYNQPQFQIKQYCGKGNFCSAKSLKEMFSGEKAIITFRDGSTYNGEIKNGLMDTQQFGERAIFISHDKMDHYEGGYLLGRRHGESYMQTKTQEGVLLKYALTWQQGRPLLNTLQLQERGPRRSLI